MKSKHALTFLLTTLLLVSQTALRAADLPDYAPAPADNPLKGFAPYAGQARDFPHRLEFSYLPLRAVMKGPDAFDWEPLERLLADVSSRGCQTVFRCCSQLAGHTTCLGESGRSCSRSK